MANFGMIRVEPLKEGAVAGRAIHHTRDYNKDRPAPAHINEKLSKRNIYVGEAGKLIEKKAGKPAKKEGYKEYMARLREKEAIHKSTQGRRTRKDSNKVADLVFARSDLGEDGEKNFNNKKWLEDTVKWVGERFGQDNIIGGSLHMDEPDKLTGKIHPHIHVMIVPMAENEKGNRICFEAQFPMGTYSELQTEYYERVGKEHGLVRGIHKVDPDTHISTKQFKGRTAAKEQRLIKAIEKNLTTNPEKVMDAVSNLVNWYAPHLASLDIQKERAEKEVRGEIEKKDGLISQLRETSQATNNLLDAERHRSASLNRENKKLSSDLKEKTKAYDLLERQMLKNCEILAFGSEPRKKLAVKRATKFLEDQGQTKPKRIGGNDVAPEYRDGSLGLV